MVRNTHLYGHSSDTYAFNLLKSAGHTYFYFKTRADMLAYLGAKPKWNSSQFLDATARCGNTGAKNGTPVSQESSILQTCTYASGNYTNPNLADVTMHETGHGFDFALAALNFANKRAYLPFSQTVGFRNLVNGTDGGYNGRRPDYIFMTSGDSIYGVPAKCGIFPNYKPSVLEQDLGLPTISMTPVCTGTTVNSPYTSLTTLQIVQKESPYFVPAGAPSGSAYQELFAQEFAIAVGFNSALQPPSSTPEMGPALPFMNWVISSIAFHCSLASVQNMRAGRSPVVLFTECPSTTANDFTH